MHLANTDVKKKNNLQIQNFIFKVLYLYIFILPFKNTNYKITIKGARILTNKPQRNKTSQIKIWETKDETFIHFFIIPFRSSYSFQSLQNTKLQWLPTAAVQTPSRLCFTFTDVCVTYWRKCFRNTGREVSGDFCCLAEVRMEIEVGWRRHRCLSVWRSGYTHSHSTALDQTLTAPTDKRETEKKAEMHFRYSKMKYLRAENCFSRREAALSCNRRGHILHLDFFIHLFFITVFTLYLTLDFYQKFCSVYKNYLNLAIG